MTVFEKRVLLSLVSACVLFTCISALTEDVANNSRTEYTFVWFIENYSYCWHRNGEELSSPQFSADDLEGTYWNIDIYPRGSKYLGYISIFLSRAAIDNGPYAFLLKYELSILAANGSALVSKEFEWAFKRGQGYGRLNMGKVDNVLLRRKADYLPQDTLSVRCKIWRGEGNIQKVKKISARTRIGIENISFIHVVKGFSTLQPNENNTVEIRSSKTGLPLSISLYFSDESLCKGKIIVEINPSDTNQILSRCKLSLLDASGKIFQCDEVDSRFDDARKDIKKLPLCLSRLEILNRKSELLPNDTFSLLWQGIFSTGVGFEGIESTLYEIPFVTLNHINEDDQKKRIYKKLFACPSALDDLKTIYNNANFTDVEIKTNSKSFPTHKVILAARSSVFNAMLSEESIEGKSNFIVINDLEEDTVEQLLLFLYSDYIDNLRWESATKLYYAGDKYKVDKLKMLCSTFLVENISVSKASELLLLSDTHDDTDLMEAVESFIFDHEEQVYSSEEWGKLMETNPILVSKTMRLKYLKNV